MTSANILCDLFTSFPPSLSLLSVSLCVLAVSAFLIFLIRFRQLRHDKRRARRIRRAIPDLQLLPSSFLPMKRPLWDIFLYPLLSWVVNLVSVLFALVHNSLQSLLCLPRHHVKLCVATCSLPTSIHGTVPPPAPHTAAEATQLGRRKQAPTLSPYFSALMVPSALSCTHTRKSLVLDLDETLVHSQFKLTPDCDLRLEVRVDDFPAVFYVSKRPYLDVFLRTVAHWYDVVIFTASLQKYGDPLISVLDVDKIVKRRMFRQDCIRKNGNFVKDLTMVNPNLADVIIVDNSPVAYSIQPSNAIPIETWYCDQKDEELLNLLPLLHALAFLNDVRSLLDLRLTGGNLVARSHHRNSLQ